MLGKFSKIAKEMTAVDPEISVNSEVKEICTGNCREISAPSCAS